MDHNVDRDSSNGYYVCRTCGWRYTQRELDSLRSTNG